jgi:hypothetical protein
MTAQDGVGGAVSLASGRQPGHCRVSAGMAAVRVLRAGAGRGLAGSGDVGRGSGNRARRWYAATRGVGRVGAGAQTMRGNKISRNGDPYQCIPYRMAAADLSFLGTGFMVLIP